MQNSNNKNSLTSITDELANTTLADRFQARARNEGRNYDVNRILNFNSETNEYTIEWSDKSVTTEPAANVSQPAIDAFNTIQAHNNAVMQNCQQQGIQPSTRKAYIMIRCSVTKDSSVKTQHLALLNFCLQNNMLAEYYSVDNGVSGRYNKQLNMMNNLNHEFGYRLPMLTSDNILIVNSMDRLGRHASTVMNIISNLMERNIWICILDTEIVLTPDNFKERGIHMKVYELAYKAQELSDEISKRVKNSIEVRKKQNILARINPKTRLLQDRQFVTETMKTFKKYDGIKKMTKNDKYFQTYEDMIVNKNVKNAKFSKTMISKIIKNQLSDNRLELDDVPMQMESSSSASIAATPAFSIKSYLSSIIGYLSG